MDFMLSDEQKRLMLIKHLEQIQLEAYQHELNRLVAVEVGDQQKEAESVAAITILETESNVYATEITYLDDPSANPDHGKISNSSSSANTPTPLVDIPIVGVQDAVGVQTSYVVQANEVTEID